MWLSFPTNVLSFLIRSNCSSMARSSRCQSALSISSLLKIDTSCCCAATRYDSDNKGEREKTKQQQQKVYIYLISFSLALLLCSDVCLLVLFSLFVVKYTVYIKNTTTTTKFSNVNENVNTFVASLLILFSLSLFYLFSCIYIKILFSV